MKPSFLEIFYVTTETWPLIIVCCPKFGAVSMCLLHTLLLPYDLGAIKLIFLFMNFFHVMTKTSTCIEE